MLAVSLIDITQRHALSWQRQWNPNEIKASRPRNNSVYIAAYVLKKSQFKAYFTTVNTSRRSWTSSFWTWANPGRNIVWPLGYAAETARALYLRHSLLGSLSSYLITLRCRLRIRRSLLGEDSLWCNTRCAPRLVSFLQGRFRPELLVAFLGVSCRCPCNCLVRVQWKCAPGILPRW